MSKIPFEFLPIPNFLIEKGWTDDPKTWRLIRILFSRCQNEGHIAYVDGREVYLEPYEFIYGRDKTAKDAGLSTNEVRTRMIKFSTSNLTSKITSKSTSTFTVYRWVTEAFCEKWHQQKHQQNNQQKQRESTSTSTSTSTTKQLTRSKSIDIREQQAAPEKAKAAAVSLELLDIPLSDKEWISKYYHDDAVVAEAIKFVTHPDFVIKKNLAAALKWALIAHPWLDQAKKLSNHEIVKKEFKHGTFHNEAECFLDEKCIAFQRGMNHRQLKFIASDFFQQFDELLRHFGIKNPFKKTINIKEA